MKDSNSDKSFKEKAGESETERKCYFRNMKRKMWEMNIKKYKREEK